MFVETQGNILCIAQDGQVNSEKKLYPELPSLRAPLDLLFYGLRPCHLELRSYRPPQTKRYLKWSILGLLSKRPAASIVRIVVDITLLGDSPEQIILYALISQALLSFR